MRSIGFGSWTYETVARVNCGLRSLLDGVSPGFDYALSLLRSTIKMTARALKAIR